MLFEQLEGDPEDTVRAAALRSLGRMEIVYQGPGGRAASKRLMLVVDRILERDTSALVRREAILVLGLGTNASEIDRRWIVAGLNDSDSSVVVASLTVVKENQLVSTLEAVSTLLLHPNVAVRVKAAETIASFTSDGRQYSSKVASTLVHESDIEAKKQIAASLARLDRSISAR
jgi:hypothetical protein